MTPKFILKLFLLTAGVFVLAVRGEENLPVLRSARAVRELNADEANQSRVAEFSGVVIGRAEPEGAGLVIKDETDSIYLLGPVKIVKELKPGDYISVRGRSDAGGYAPYLKADEIQKIGTRVVPEPEQISPEDIFSKGLDAEWIAVKGVVRDVRYLRPDEVPRGYLEAGTPLQEQGALGRRMKMTLVIGDRLLPVQLYGPLNIEPYVDAEVEVRGLCFNQHNAERQFLNPLILVPRGVDIRILRPAPAGPFDGPAISATSLYQFKRSGLSIHRVHVEGVVLHQEPGTGFWIRSEGHGLFAESDQTIPLKPGDRVQVAGFPEHGPFAPILAHCIYRKQDAGPEPQPSVLSNHDQAARHNADLVVVEGTLLDRKETDEGLLLRLDWLGSEITALCNSRQGSFGEAALEVGSVLSVAGICVVSSGRDGPLSGVLLPGKYSLIMRTAADIAVIRAAPWWTWRRMVQLLAAIIALLAAILATVFIASRRKIAKERALRAAEVSEYSARLAERSRMARELHDSVAQGLGAISLQLELAGSGLTSGKNELSHHLSLGQQLVRTSMVEVRSFIRNLRTQTQQDVDLASALKDLLHLAIEGTAIATDFRIDGVVRKLPANVEAQVIRITQEAVSNAVRHSGAARISLRIQHSSTTLAITVADDGRGFDVTTDWVPQGHFGLLGMKERAALIGATLQVSTDGTGARVLLTVPRDATIRDTE